MEQHASPTNNLSSSQNVRIRPATAAVVPHYMRSKADTLRHNRLEKEHEKQQQYVEGKKLEREMGNSLSNHANDNSAEFPGVFHSTYEVSYTPPRGDGRQTIRPKTTGTSNGVQVIIPPNINQASLREKKRYMSHQSRDVTTRTPASHYIVEFQHHMRHSQKAEVSRNVRKTEPPQLENLFEDETGFVADTKKSGSAGRNGKGTDVSVSDIVLRRNAKLRLQDEEKVRHRSLLYDKVDYYERHPQLIEQIQRQQQKQRAASNNNNSSLNPSSSSSTPAAAAAPHTITTSHRHSTNNNAVEAVIDLVEPPSIAVGKRRRHALAAASVLNLGATLGLNNDTSKNFHHSRRSASACDVIRCNPSMSPHYRKQQDEKRELFSDSPPRYRKAFFNTKQFEKHAPVGWDRVPKISHEMRTADLLNNNNNGWQHDWVASVSPYENAMSVQRSATREMYQQNKNVSGSGGDSGGGTVNNNKTNTPAISNNNNSTNPRILPRPIRDQIADGDVPTNETILTYCKDPMIKMDLVKKQKNWRSEYGRLKDEFRSEAERKEEVLREIKDLQKTKDKFNRTESSICLI